MSKIKPFLKYLAGIDVFEDRRRYCQNIGEQSLKIKATDIVEIVVGRYAPIVMGVKGLMSFFDGQFFVGMGWVLGAGYLTFTTNFIIKGDRELLNEVNELNETSRELEKRVQLMNQSEG